jgi:hypothetical protein
VPPRRRPANEDRTTAIRIVLTALADGRDLFEAAGAVRELHPKNNTFPGEVFVRLAADALELSGATRDAPLAYEGVIDKFLPECEFRGRDNRKIKFALLAAAATRGGVEPDLLDEVTWWNTDDFWQYGFFAAVAWIRASAEHLDVPTDELCHQLAARHGIDLHRPT